ncbi:hypothetical protein K8O68_21085 [Salipaludibacillus sp. CUR1]|uniref:hypothetical protein n=1 Tax=Salipaludibacillus sp. CUR1 TaxID=2820003 RepID=UPI001E2D327E|nr:hypothetical protein [Salipaludibacillus sp. CUR1]MCE7794887.1 hypothetical protein [Salipaludibacillus sp. CUR1]
MRLTIGVVIFSVVALAVFFTLNSAVDWPVEVIVISSLLAGGVTEWLFHQYRKRHE